MKSSHVDGNSFLFKPTGGFQLVITTIYLNLIYCLMGHIWSDPYSGWVDTTSQIPLITTGNSKKKNVWKKNAMCPPKCETQPSHRHGRNVTSGAELDMRNTLNTTYNNIQHIHMLRTYIYHLSCALMFEQRLNTWNSWSPTGPKEILQLRGCCSWRHL